MNTYAIHSGDDWPSQILPNKTKDQDTTSSILLDLFDAYGLSNDKERIAEALPYGQQSLELIDVLNIMVRLGYTGAPLSLRLCDLDARLLPCLFEEQNTGQLRVIREPTSDTTQGNAYFFEKERERLSREKREELDVTGRGWTASTLNRFRPLFWRLLGISLALNIISLGLPIFLMIIYDRVADVTTEWTIYALGIGALIMLSLEWAFRRLRSQNLAWFSSRFNHIVSNSIISRLLLLPAPVIEGGSVAAQLSRLKSFEALREFLTGPVFLTLLDVPFILLALILLTAIAGKLVFIPLSIVVVYCTLILYFRPRLKLAMFHVAQARSQAQAHHIELLEKLQSLRLNGMCEIWFEQFRDISAQGAIAAFHAQYKAQLLEVLLHLLGLIGGVALIYWGVTLVWDNSLSGGGLFASILLAWRILGPMQTLGGSISRLEQLSRNVQQIDRLMSIDTERDVAPGLAKIPKIEGAIDFVKVGLRYSKDTDPVFAGLSLSVAPGETIAIAGGNGSGKSTILKLILGLYRPQAGAVLLDDRDIRQIDPVLLRKKLSYVPQIPELFQGTIADNIRFANKLATDTEIWDALRLADAKDEIASLPNGLNTSVLSGGEGFSSGLAFRINLARAFIKNSPVLLIDELPYTILNSKTGERFIELIQSWHGQKTIIMVSHRDDHIQLADQAIGLLQGGRTIVNTPSNVIQKLRDDAFIQGRG